MIKLYRFSKDYGRFGVLSGCFFSDEDLLTNTSYPGVISFSDCLGKHSEIDLEWKEVLEEIKLSQEALVELREAVGDTVSGYNLLGYLKDYD